MSTHYLLGIDLGTSSVKAALFMAHNFDLAAVADREYRVSYPQPGYAEQDPQDWWQATVQALREVLDQAPAGRVIGIGLDGQMHGLVCLGQDEQPVCPAIIWADARATAEVEELAERQKDFEAILPGPPAAGFAAASALWMSHHQPHLLRQTRTILCPKDYVRLRLTGLSASDASDASATWLFDIGKNEWAPEVVKHCGLRLQQLPPLKPSASIAGTLSKEAARVLDLRAGMPIVTGCADLPAQALGHGIVDPQRILVTVGTGGQVFVPRLSPQPDPAGRHYLFCHSADERWYAQAAVLCGGLSLRWLRDTLGLAVRPDAYAQLSSLAAGVPAGAEGLIFMPYLAGERSPHMDPQAAGLFLGLRLHHGPGHLARAVMEGVGFALQECLSLVDDGAGQITLSGGVTQSAVWPQILSNIWGRPLHMPASDLPRAALGSAILAGVGVGLYADVRKATAVRAEPAMILQPRKTELYIERYEQYQRLYPLLKEEMHHLHPG